MILDTVTIFSTLIRAAFLPHTLDRQSPHRPQFGMWSAFNAAFSDQGINIFSPKKDLNDQRKT